MSVIKDKTAKVVALRTATAVLYNSLELDWEGVEEENIEKINKELNNIAKSMYNRAKKIGGDFNRFTGF